MGVPGETVDQVDAEGDPLLVEEPACVFKPVDLDMAMEYLERP